MLREMTKLSNFVPPTPYFRKHEHRRAINIYHK